MRWSSTHVPYVSTYLVGKQRVGSEHAMRAAQGENDGHLHQAFSLSGPASTKSRDMNESKGLLRVSKRTCIDTLPRLCRAWGRESNSKKKLKNDVFVCNSHFFLRSFLHFAPSIAAPSSGGLPRAHGMLSSTATDMMFLAAAQCARDGSSVCYFSRGRKWRSACVLACVRVIPDYSSQKMLFYVNFVLRMSIDCSNVGPCDRNMTQNEGHAKA